MRLLAEAELQEGSVEAVVPGMSPRGKRAAAHHLITTMNLSKEVRVSGGWYCQVHVPHVASRPDTSRSGPQFEDVAM